jgi:hypothetical protein
MDEECLERCVNIHKEISSRESAWPFLHPVDHVGLNLPTYLSEIPEPMDLGTISSHLQDDVYEDVSGFRRHMLLVFQNAIKFNDSSLEGSVGHIAKQLFDLTHLLFQTHFPDDEWDQQSTDGEFSDQERMKQAREMDLNGRWKAKSFVARYNRGKRISLGFDARKDIA